MVKGNYERRKELAERRKQDRVDEKQRRTAGPISATPTEVRARLLSDAQKDENGDGESELVAWVVIGGATKLFCEDYFRTGSCPTKRCKFCHDVSIAHLQGLPEAPCVQDTCSSKAKSEQLPSSQQTRSGGAGRKKKGSAGGRGHNKLSSVGGSPDDIEPLPAGGFPALEPVQLRSVSQIGGNLAYDRNVRTQVRQTSTLRFVQWGKRCVYDWQNPSVFAEYCRSTSVKKEQIRSQVLAASTTDRLTNEQKSAQTFDGGESPKSSALTDKLADAASQSVAVDVSIQGAKNPSEIEG